MFFDLTIGQKLLLLKRLTSSGGSIQTLTGNLPQSVSDALAKAIKSLTQYGLCTQADTPTPSAPQDIKCNNGALRMVDDELPTGYKRVLGFKCNNNAMWQITGFKLKGSDTVRVSFSVEAACNVWGCYQGADATDNYDLYASVSAGSKYLRYGSGTYLSYWSPTNLGERFDTVVTPTGTSGMPQDSTWSPATFTSANDLLIGSTTTGGTSAKLKGNLYGDFIVEQNNAERLHLVPCERTSDNVLGYYDLVGEAFYEPYEGYDGAVSLGYDGSHYRLETVGTAEVLTISASGATPQTASVADLYSVGDFKDEQDIISGQVTRKCGIWVLTGEENWTVASSNTNVYYLSSTYFPEDYGIVTRFTPICSHLVGVLSTVSISAMTANTVKTNNSSKIIYACVGADYTKDEWKAFVANQYALGTPVIIVYPLAEETSERVAAQVLHTTAGDNTISATAEVSPIAIEMEYMGTGES